jgi:hypothetical protein
MVTAKDFKTNEAVFTISVLKPAQMTITGLYRTYLLQRGSFS